MRSTLTLDPELRIMYLGIEIGGTKLQFGVGPGDGQTFVDFVRREIDRSQGAAGIRSQILDVVRELKSKHHLLRVGYGFGGPVLGRQGVVQTRHQAEGWDRFPLVRWTQQELALPARLGNDCDVAALAEAYYGAARDVRTSFYVTVGTGVGGGWIVDRQIHGSDRPAAAEIGHLRPPAGGGDPHATIEAVAAGPGIAKKMEDLVKQHPADDAAVTQWIEQVGADVSQWNTREIGLAAQNGNRLALEAYRRATSMLGWGIGQMITLLAPHRVIVGGGVSLVGDKIFFEPLRAAAHQSVFTALQGSYEIVPAALGESVVVHGALALAAAA